MREMFLGSNLVLQWVPGSGKVVRGDTKMSPGRVSPGVLQRGVIKATMHDFGELCVISHMLDTSFYQTQNLHYEPNIVHS